jgi:hypothetical protein
MLRSLTLPASWRAVLDTFRPAFRRSSTFAVFALLATGLVAQAGRRTVVGMLAGVGVAAAVSFHTACRFFSRHTWDADRIGLALARLVVDRLLGEHAPIMVVVDDTLIRRWGPKVFGAVWTHDGSAQDPNALGRGNRWVVAGIVLTVPFCSHPVCPAAFTYEPARRHYHQRRAHSDRHAAATRHLFSASSTTACSTIRPSTTLRHSPRGAGLQPNPVRSPGVDGAFNRQMRQETRRRELQKRRWPKARNACLVSLDRDRCLRGTSKAEADTPRLSR